jgi:hypothetical protein
VTQADADKIAAAISDSGSTFFRMELFLKLRALYPHLNFNDSHEQGLVSALKRATA